MNRYSHVIWDWNGTLLDDVRFNLSVINTMLEKRGLPPLDSLEAYRAVFSFPIIHYYKRVGFDMEKEPFEQLAAEFIALYHAGKNSIPLFPGTEETLRAISLAGIRQVILSASEAGMLLEQVQSYGIHAYFDEIIGIGDIYASGKIDQGRAYMKRAKPARAALIGDTTHDMETAQALGADLILIGRGHQSKQALLSCGAALADDFTQLPGILGLHA